MRAQGRMRARGRAHADAHARPRPLNACDHPRAAVGLRARMRAHEPGGGLTCALRESLTSTLGRQIMASEGSSSHDLIAELRSQLMEARNETAEMRAQLELSGNCRPEDEKPADRIHARIGFEQIDIEDPVFIRFRNQLCTKLQSSGKLGVRDSDKEFIEAEAWCMCGDIEDLCRDYSVLLHSDPIDLILAGLGEFVHMWCCQMSGIC